MEEFANFNVPLFNGFEDDESVETYFDVDHHTEENQDTNSEYSDKYESFSVTETANGPTFNLRKSISSGNMIFEQELERKLETKNVKVTSRCDVHLEYLKKRNRAKYYSTAEQVANFWFQSDYRFSSKLSTVSCNTRPKPTVAHSPVLRAQNRCRSKKTLSREQLEEQEYMEAQKHHPKPLPLNKKIFLAPKIPELPPKHTTVVKPFNLTQTKTKRDETPPEVFKFQACPVPTWVINGPKLRVPFKPRTITKKIEKKVLPKPQPTEELKRTQVQPFSFDLRDKQLILKREQYIKKIIEEEKNAREFKAKPIASAVLNTFSKSASSSVKSAKSEDAINGLSCKPFKATEPKVLYHEPFIPKRSNKKTSPIGFQLSTENRAKNREEFERKRKEKEALQEEIRQRRAKEEQEREQLEIQRLRKQAEFKANPIRHFKELQASHSGKITIPHTPNIKHVRANKENHS